MATGRTDVYYKPSAIVSVQKDAVNQKHVELPKIRDSGENVLFNFTWKGNTMKKTNKGAGRYGTHRGAFEKNKKKIMATQTVCGICGKPVDKSLKYPHPMSACIDHIIPIARGGHPSDIDNMQLAHWMCNRLKADHLPKEAIPGAGSNKKIKQEEINNRNLPQSIDWVNYRS